MLTVDELQEQAKSLNASVKTINAVLTTLEARRIVWLDNVADSEINASIAHISKYSDALSEGVGEGEFTRGDEI